MSIEIALVVPNSGDATSYYRGFGPMNALKKQYGVVTKVLSKVTWVELADSDIVYFQRPHANEHIALIQLAKQIGVKVWVDFDDLLCGLTPDNPAYDFFNHFSKNVIQALTMADHVTVSSQFLLDEYSKYNKSISIIPNAWNDSINPRPFDCPKLNSLGNRSVFWRGTDTHQRDLYEVQNEIKDLSKVSSLSFMGYRPWFLHGVGQKINPLDVIGYMNFMKNVNFNVNIVPLHDSPFNRAKSNISWIESTVAGAVCVAPDFPEWNRPGIINYGPTRPFKDAVLEALEVANHGFENKKSEEFIRENLTLSTVNQSRILIAEKLSGKRKDKIQDFNG